MIKPACANKRESWKMARILVADKRISVDMATWALKHTKHTDEEIAAFFRGEKAPWEKIMGRPPVRVQCVETGQTFPSVREAAVFLKLKGSGSVSRAINYGRLCGGFHWQFCQEDITRYENAAPATGDAEKEEKKPKGRKYHEILCVETGRVFDSVWDATIWAGLKWDDNIRKALKSGKACGGYHWKPSSSASCKSSAEAKETLRREQ